MSLRFKLYPILMIVFLVFFAGRCRYGCTDPGALNYERNAVRDDGSCQYEYQYGCTDANANNYSTEAIYDDGTCQWDVDQFQGGFLVTDSVVDLSRLDTAVYSYQMMLVRDGESTKRVVFWGLGGLAHRESQCRAEVNKDQFSIRAQLAAGDTSWGRLDYLEGSGSLFEDTLVFRYRIMNAQNEEYLGFGRAIKF